MPVRRLQSIHRIADDCGLFHATCIMESLNCQYDFPLKKYDLPVFVRRRKQKNEKKKTFFFSFRPPATSTPFTIVNEYKKKEKENVTHRLYTGTQHQCDNQCLSKLTCHVDNPIQRDEHPHQTLTSNRLLLLLFLLLLPSKQWN